ncbi:3a09b1f3-6ff7-4593-bbfc-50c44ec5f744 [Thermothielavioides terrestris]|uniref:3a09b1f3-6ff7-4593-bbfc-50c44ec5f744 n=1 Tax=Thermothielavioides terrestris TaxID=2587410 RepID=A0A3S4BK15_9PEZI|nr:3a09b1f3-6ff7-4593-bbfc-50c44ec5f744 [Thermothielavioides terrestris]
MATSPQAFYCLWQNENIRERLFELLSKQDICAVRLANSACCNLVTKRLFLRTHLTFTANSFTKASRLDALSRIGHHIEHLTFYFPHSNATFLPPLIHPQSGEEISFMYSPPTSAKSVLTRRKYGNSELGEILTQQYPPLFHAATHVPSFISAMEQMTNMRHLTIKTPGQDPRERYRRSIVDYALISLRISLERAPLTKLSKLSLSGVHPSAFQYLRHVPGMGASPSAALRWRQIRKLYISAESWDFYGPSPGLDQLRIIEDYIRAFAPQLDKFSFTWLGRRGPCPIALSDDPLFAPPRSSKKLFNEVTSPMSPLPPRPSPRTLAMPRLRSMSVRNATMNAQQLRVLVASHKHTVREFDFENVALIRGGSWDEALAPLTENGSSDAWSRHSVGASDSRPGTARSNSSGSAVVSSVDDEQLPASSAAAEAASRELFEVDLEGMVFGGANDVEAFEAGVEEWARGVSAAAQQSCRPNSSGGKTEDDGGLASDIEAAKQASQGFTTKLKKRRIRRKSRKHDREEAVEEESQRSREDRVSERRSNTHSHHSHHSRSHHKHSRSEDTSDRLSRRDSHRRHGRHRRHRSEEVVEIPFMPEVIGTDDEAYQPPATPRPKMDISVPILNPEPLPVMLQPTVYDPSARHGPLTRTPDASPSSDDGLSSAQRSIEADLLAEAEEAAARASALKRAKEAVITKLSREFSKRKADGSDARNKESAAAAAVAAGLSALSFGMNLPAHHHHHHHRGLSCASSSSVAYRLREGLFGRSMAHVAVAPDHRSLESQSALVPLILSRS